MGVGAYPVNRLFVGIITCVRQGISVAKLPGVYCWLKQIKLIKVGSVLWYRYRSFYGWSSCT